MALASITTPDLRTISAPAAMDPDISATLSDFLTYTEHLPSAVLRSLTLIETLNSKAAALQTHIHRLLTTYSILPTITDDAPDPVQMRRDISHAYDKLEECKRMSSAEAVRMEELVTREAKRLHLVTHKLNALPMPPSRDATPDPVLSSPHLKRTAQTQAQLSADKRVAAHRTTTAPRVRNRDKLMVPGEVLPPPNPDSPPPSEPDDWTSPGPSEVQEARQKSVARQKTPKAPRPPKPPKDRAQKTPRVRPPGTPGTNAHSAVAGISTSNAIMALTRPPADAVPGSKWLPWNRLTEFELAILRKRMKKNAAWKPSPAMRNRELKQLGRGFQARDDAKAQAEAGGTVFVDDYNQDTWVDPTSMAVSGEQQAEMNAILGPERDQADGDQALINRGMRLNEAKKLKREMQRAEENATLQPPVSPDRKPLASQTAESKKPKDQHHSKSGPSESKRPSQTHPSNSTSESATHAKPFKPATPADAASKKRKRDATPPRTAHTGPTDTIVESPDVLSLTRPVPERKKLKLNPPLPPPESVSTVLQPKSATPVAPSPRVSARPRSQRPSVVPEQTPLAQSSSTRAARSSTTITIKRQKAASAEPPSRRALRRGSNASLPGAGGKKTQSPVPKAAAPESGESAKPSRRRRPAPGVVASQEDGSAKVSVGKRSKPPVKKQSQQAKSGNGATAKDQLLPGPVAEEEVDPDEERYCICNDVSFGVMIACDNNDCPKEWFHLDCVGLKEMPPRRAKWYCPDCRKKLKLGIGNNGIVPHR